MTIYTSYFAKCKSGERRLSICRRPPDWYTGRRCYLLAPDAELLWKYKNKEITAREFTAIYTDYLNTLGIDAVLNELHEGDILLCWEAKGKFCHRHVLAAWLKSYGYIVTELE